MGPPPTGCSGWSACLRGMERRSPPTTTHSAEGQTWSHVGPAVAVLLAQPGPAREGQMRTRVHTPPIFRNTLSQGLPTAMVDRCSISSEAKPGGQYCSITCQFVLHCFFPSRPQTVNTHAYICMDRFPIHVKLTLHFTFNA